MTSSPITPEARRMSRRVATLDAIVAIMAGNMKNRRGEYIRTWSQFGSYLFSVILPEGIQADELTTENVAGKLIPIVETILTNLRNVKAGKANELIDVMRNLPRLRKRKKVK